MYLVRFSITRNVFYIVRIVFSTKFVQVFCVRRNMFAILPGIFCIKRNLLAILSIVFYIMRNVLNILSIAYIVSQKLMLAI